MEATRRETFLSFQPPAIGEEEIEAVTETLRSGWLTTGPRTAELESRMRDYLEAEHVLAVSSCTAVLVDTVRGRKPPSQLSSTTHR